MAQTPTARTTAFSAIDKEIDRARQLIFSLLSHRNALAPISTLPPEILSCIFHFHVHNDPPCEKALGWICTTHVCRHWRQVALNDPSLWATITGFLPGVRLTSEMLVRACNVPLVIDLSGVPSPEVLSKFIPYISCIRELRLRCLSRLHSHPVREICTLEAPALEHFELGVSGHTPFNFCKFAGTMLLKGRAPKLRTFSLDQIFIPWELIPCGQLTQLRITLSGVISSPGNLSPNDLNQLIDLLIDSPNLEVIVFEFCLPSQLSQVSPKQQIYLPHLSRLDLSETTARVTNLLKTLGLQSSAKLYLHCTCEDTFTHMILPLISVHFQNPTPVEFKSLSLTLCHRDYVVVVATSIDPHVPKIYDPSIHRGVQDTKAELTLCFDGISISDFEESILGRMCSILPISNLELLSISAIDDDNVIQSGNWYELFQQCNNVATIQAKGRGTINLFLALAPPKVTDTMTGSKGRKWRRDNRSTPVQAGDNVIGTHATTTFPKLTALCLDDLNLSIAMPYCGTLYDVLMNAILWREKHKVPLKTLSINRCTIPTNCANNLKKCVQEFSWDGDEGATNDEWDGYDSDDSSDFAFPPWPWLADLQVFSDFSDTTTQAEWE